jgi:predicted DNA-binding transcriptional regulator YafY
MRMVQAWGGPQLAASAVAALAKITLALPKEKREFVEATALFAPAFHMDPLHGERLEVIRQAIRSRNKLQVEYADVDDRHSQRMVWPLALYFFGGHWLLAAWCELRGDFRSFRLDRVKSLADRDAYPSQEGRRLADFVRKMQHEER